MLVLDLDGTTLNGAGELRPVDIAAARALTEHGVHVTIATGRLFTGTQWVAQELGVTGGVAVMNGNEILDAHTAATHHGRYVKPAERALAQEIFEDLDLASPVLFGSRRIHFRERDAHLRDWLSIWTPDLSTHRDVFDADEWSNADDIVAIGVLGKDDAIRQAQARLLDASAGGLQSVVFRTDLGDTFLKFRHQGDDKGTALAKMAHERGTTTERTIAVGDWLNDLPMLMRAGHSFAMAHSDPRVIDAAKETLRSERHAGGAVAEVAERIWGITP